MSDTKIEWTEKVWNPVTGCSKVSQGCKNCYAESVAHRFWGEREFTDVRCHEDRLDAPLHWRKPVRVFVNSMSDLFHEKVPFEFIWNVWCVMSNAPQHTFQILTKRPARMLEFTQWVAGRDHISIAEWPRNVWLGVSVEDQKTADERIPLLLQTPAAVRWISAEPLLGPINLTYPNGYLSLNRRVFFGNPPITGPALDWVVVGGESGPGARPMHPDWVRGLADACKSTRTPFFFKQWGEWKAEIREGTEVDLCSLAPNQCVAAGDMKTCHTLYTRVGKTAAGSLLDGHEWKEYPK